MIVERLEQQYIDFVNNYNLSEDKKCIIQHSYINKIIEFAIKENNNEKIKEYNIKKHEVEETLAKFGIKIN